MDLGIVTNVLSLTDEGEGATTLRLAASACRRGHRVWLLGTGDFILDGTDFEGGDRLEAAARRVELDEKKSTTTLPALRAVSSRGARLDIGSLDVLFLRSNPSVQKPWAQSAGIEFGRIAAKAGVRVLSDPEGLSRASNKLYLQSFAPEVRPRTIVTRQVSAIEEFAREQGKIILKPLRGSGGQGVFMAKPGDNFAEMVRAVSRDGYVVAQEYLPEASEGDTRLFFLDGAPLVLDGKIAAFRRVRSGDDLRSNVSVGGKIRRAHLSPEILERISRVGPKLIEDGMFLVGLDLVGEKLLEINVFSPGGLGNAQRLEGVDFTEAVIDALERRAA